MQISVLTLQWKIKFILEWNTTMAGPESLKYLNVLPICKNLFLISLHCTETCIVDFALFFICTVSHFRAECEYFQMGIKEKAHVYQLLHLKLLLKLSCFTFIK